MTADDLARIQEELDVELPKTYREFVRKYPKTLLEAKRHMTKGDESPAELELLNDADALIACNSGVQASQGLHDFPAEYFVIGQSGCGDYYAIDTDDDDSPVYFWNHEIGDFDEEEEHESLAAFAAELIRGVKLFNEAVGQRRGGR